ncbi:MAG: N-acetylmuramoyl-L-alanine amidase [Paludibacteraceae bacterium]|nr:N-acetylmuramoyl-L-alanine amidase [Paludibacteraceae bacterium]
MSYKSILLSIAALMTTISMSAFTIVIDAGHGGHDAGAVGSFSKEKNINLRHATLLGDMIKERNPEIKVIYTRDKDIFIELNERARIANRNKADLFVSIHTNSSKNKSATGIEVFSLGVSRNKENMDVAMLENSVILLEEDHESKYQGFDPNSTDSYIMFEFMKDQYMERSIECADFVQSKLVDASGRTDRGVRQAGFLVLRATAMPSILIELGFISNREEEKALNNDDQQIANAESIYKGLMAYIHNLEKKGAHSTEPATVQDSVTTMEPAPAVAVATAVTADSTVNVSPAVVVTDPSKVIYKIQILVSSTKRNPSDAVFKGYGGVEEIKEASTYKYFIGASEDYDKVAQLRESAKKDFTGAFIVAYKNGVRVNVKETLKNK